jgi:squalene-hopene/tetraprenyl-beta-curcumene cyclase
MFALSSADANRTANAAERGASWLLARQQPDGSWPAVGRSGAVECTSIVVRALAAVGSSSSHEAVAAGAAWLLAHQQSDGGWGDAEQEEKGIAGEGLSTARHTASAVLGLLAAGQGGNAAVARGADYLLATQTSDGDWPAMPASSCAMPPATTDAAEALLALGRYAARPAFTMHDSPRLRIASISRD